jgi:hypothetical protein
LPYATRSRSRLASVFADRVSLALVLIFLIGVAYYLWTAATSMPLSLTSPGGGTSSVTAYNQLATALLHLHLSVGPAPAGLVHLANPYDPAQNAAYDVYHDLSLYHGRFYIDWGPAPAVTLLVPLHLLGLSPSPSVVVALFAIGGLGFAFATLRILLRRFDALPLWMSILAAAVLVFSTSLPFILRRPLVYEEAIAGGYFFVMAGLFLALSAIVRRRASLVRLVLMSLCFGLAVGSRPTLLAAALLLVPVYLAVRGSRPQRELLTGLVVPCGLCLLLLLAYNYARFSNPLEAGQSYNLAGWDPRTVHFGSVAYILPNLWNYVISPPRPTILFPFLALTPPPFTYPLADPAGYGAYGWHEITGGLLVMSPLLLFAFALPWLRRRRPQSVEPVGTPMLVAAGAGLFALLFCCFEFFGSTERYEVDFAALLLFAALTAWFALSLVPPAWQRRAARIVGAVLALWGCLTGIAVSFTGYSDLLQLEHPGTFKALEHATSPISTAIATVAGHPVLARVEAPFVSQTSPMRLTTIGAGIDSFSLPAGDSATLTIVSPDRRLVAIVANLKIGLALHQGAALSLAIHDASSPHEFSVLRNGRARVPLEVNRGLNRVVLTPVASAINPPNPTVAASNLLLKVSSLTLAGHY